MTMNRCSLPGLGGMDRAPTLGEYLGVVLHFEEQSKRAGGWARVPVEIYMEWRRYTALVRMLMQQRFGV